MGRARKPFLEKSSTIFLRFSNIEIVELLEKHNIEYEVPQMIWDSKTIETLKGEIKDKLLNK